MFTELRGSPLMGGMSFLKRLSGIVAWPRGTVPFMAAASITVALRIVISSRA